MVESDIRLLLKGISIVRDSNEKGIKVERSSIILKGISL